MGACDALMCDLTEYCRLWLVSDASMVCCCVVVCRSQCMCATRPAYDKCFSGAVAIHEDNSYGTHVCVLVVMRECVCVSMCCRLTVHDKA